MDMSLDITPGVGDGQGGLVCCNSWGHKESDTTGHTASTSTHKGPMVEIRFLQHSLCVGEDS